jgi:hypothetical protein
MGMSMNILEVLFELNHSLLFFPVHFLSMQSNPKKLNFAVNCDRKGCQSSPEAWIQESP